MSPTSTHSPPATLARESPTKRLAFSQPLPTELQSTQHGESPDTSLRHNGTNRRNTSESQKSHTSQKSHKPAHEKRRTSEADRNETQAKSAYVSTMSLPEYRSNIPLLYWPRDGVTQKGPQVLWSEVGHNPDEARLDRPFINESNKSTIRAMVLVKHDGRQEHVALKMMKCDFGHGTPEFKKTYDHEYNILAKLKHNHIVATVGRFVEDLSGDRHYGLLLYPLAPYNLAVMLEMVSEHNEKRSSTATGWKTDDRSGDLLNYVACLCRAVIYLHNLDKPRRHRDIKPDNVLVDRFKNVLLADFDIAKKYTNRMMASTSSRAMYTDEFAPQTVKDGEERSFDGDIFSLACVFFQMATVAFGETLKNMRKHMCGGIEGLNCIFSDALDSGALYSWIQHLKDVANRTPEHLPMDRFQHPKDNSAVQTDKSVEKFLDMIALMLGVKIDDNHAEILSTAWQCFSSFASRNCPDCHPKVCLNIIARSQHHS
jgi:serine/threonine protein kinase